MTNIAWLAADWGTTKLRVWAMDASDQSLDCRTSADGMGRLGGDPMAFERAFGDLTRDWRGERVLPVVVCGMAGAREGWREAPYAPVDTPLHALAGRAVRVPTAEGDLDVRLLPGVRQDAPPDVMRGEETKLVGLGAAAGLIVMPGTHSKWARLEEGRIRRFQTAMTGDVFQAIAANTVLRHSLGGDDGELDLKVFADAVAEARAAPASLLRRCFGLRATDLLTGPEPLRARARLSGWLTGLEVQDALHALDAADAVTLVGSGEQAVRYGRALGVFGIDAEHRDADALTLQGLVAARHHLFRDHRQ